MIPKDVRQRHFGNNWSAAKKSHNQVYFINVFTVPRTQDSEDSDRMVCENKYTNVYKAFNDVRLLLFLKEAQSWNDPADQLVVGRDPSDPIRDEDETDWESDNEEDDHFNFILSSSDDDDFPPMEQKYDPLERRKSKIKN